LQWRNKKQHNRINYNNVWWHNKLVPQWLGDDNDFNLLCFASGWSDKVTQQAITRKHLAAPFF
jgi:hypothetical protein